MKIKVLIVIVAATIVSAVPSNAMAASSWSSMEDAITIDATGAFQIVDDGVVTASWSS